MCMPMGGGGGPVVSTPQAAMNPLQMIQDRIGRSDYHLAGAAGDDATAKATAFMAGRDADAARLTEAHRGEKAKWGPNWAKNPQSLFGKSGTRYEADYNGFGATENGLSIPKEYKT